MSSKILCEIRRNHHPKLLEVCSGRRTNVILKIDSSAVPPAMATEKRVPSKYLHLLLAHDKTKSVIILYDVLCGVHKNFIVWCNLQAIENDQSVFVRSIDKFANSFLRGLAPDFILVIADLKKNDTFLIFIGFALNKVNHHIEPLYLSGTDKARKHRKNISFVFNSILQVTDL